SSHRSARRTVVIGKQNKPIQVANRVPPDSTGASQGRNQLSSKDMRKGIAADFQRTSRRKRIECRACRQELPTFRARNRTATAQNRWRSGALLHSWRNKEGNSPGEPFPDGLN